MLPILHILRNWTSYDKKADMYSLIEDIQVEVKNIYKGKTLISFRAKKTTRVMTDEQKKASAERLRKARENKSV